MRTNYVLIDYENVQVKSLELLQEEHFRARVFLGPNNTKLPVDLVLAMQRFGSRAEYVQLETPGLNALDFHLAFYMGQLTVEDSVAFYHVISRDKGFDPLIRHLKGKGILAARSESIEEMPCFNPPAAAIPAPTKLEPVRLVVAEGKTIDDSTLKLVVADLVARKAARPRTIRTLLNTIHSKVGKATDISEVEGIYKALRQRGYVKEAGDKVSYALPT
ncbi:PIN domain-containing protein [Pseudomonas solani]|uniref:PIN domain-containing protein n=1 Tax=Pseudomonas solani TaxID=2731552 RepID=A0AAU7XVP8_9PSED